MCGIYLDKLVQKIRFLVLSYCKFLAQIRLFCLMITLVCSEGLAGMMVRSDFNRPFDRPFRSHH